MRWDYWHGPDKEDRRVAYADQFSPTLQANGDETQRRIAAVEVAYRADGGPELPEGYSSGWRPRAVNASAHGAAARSTHLVANAGDKRDTPDGDFAWWCARNPGVLEQHGLWMEHPVATVVRAWITALKGGRTPTPWCHLQRSPPRSGARVYFPDAQAIEEWAAFTGTGLMSGATFEAWRAIQKEEARAAPVNAR